MVCKLEATDEKLVEMWWLNHVLERVLICNDCLTPEMLTAAGHRLRNLQMVTGMVSKEAMVSEISARWIDVGKEPPAAVSLYVKCLCKES